MSEVTTLSVGPKNAAPQVKICTSCGIEKPHSEYYRDKSKKHGIGSYCKSCAAERARKSREENPEKARARNAEWRKKNRARHNAKNAEWRRNNPEKAREHQRRYTENNPEKVKASKKKWAEANPDYMAEKARLAARKRLSTPRGRLEAAIKAGVYAALKGKKGHRKTFDLLGYSSADLMSHLERHFEPGMSWDNYGRGGWEVDHTVPLAAHNYDDPENIDFKRAWDMKNLRPMWMRNNRVKNSRLPPGGFQPSLKI